jgi:hypothetical protein
MIAYEGKESKAKVGQVNARDGKQAFVEKTVAF